MKYIILFMLTSIAINSNAADTTFYENGNVKSICKRWQTCLVYYEDGTLQWNYKRNKFIKSYYRNGNLKRFDKYDNLISRGKSRNYDSLGRVTSKGKIAFNQKKHGKWKFYDENRDCTTIKYKFGKVNDSLLTSDGKKVKCILTYGYGPRNGPCPEAIDHYRVRYIPVSGCLVTRKLRAKTSFHNGFVRMRMRMKHGSDWEKNIKTRCFGHKR